MPKTIRHFQDELTIDPALPGRLGAAEGGDTLVLGGRLITLAALTPSFNYVIAADRLTVPRLRK